MRADQRGGLLRGWIAVVGLGGVAALAWALRALPRADIQPAEVAVFAVLLLASELLPIRIARRDGLVELTTTPTFAIVILLRWGLPIGLLTLVAVVFAVDVAGRKPLYKAWFNAAQYALSLVAAAVVLDLGSAVLPSDRGIPQLPVLLGVAVAFFVVNSTTVAVALALANGVPLGQFLSTDFTFQAVCCLLQVGLAPVILAVAAQSAWLLPMLLLPVAAVHTCARVLVARDHDARHDALTGLPNRSEFQREVDDANAELAAGRSLAVLLLDIDRFREVNDTLGHTVGDELLREVTARLQAQLGAGEVVGRLGGDEFALLLPDVAGPGEAELAALRVEATLEEPVHLAEIDLQIAASIGIALAPQHGRSASQLLQRADVAMYEAKHLTTGHAVYDERTDPSRPERLALVGELKRALAEEAGPDGQLQLHFQPKRRIADGRITGVEALLRWQHPQLGPVGPDAFIPVAERTGMIDRVTRRVLHVGLAQIAGWEASGLHLDLAVNVSVRNLHDRTFVRSVREALEASGVAPERLVLELTESMIMTDPERATVVLDDLRDMGVELAIDDFGTGYSSLTYLSQLPVQELKIDRSFVMKMGAGNHAAIVRSTIDLARNLGLRTVAEGVEDDATARSLAGLGCDVLQGFHIGRPVPAADLPGLILRDTPPLPRAPGR